MRSGLASYLLVLLLPFYLGSVGSEVTPLDTPNLRFPRLENIRLPFIPPKFRKLQAKARKLKHEQQIASTAALNASIPYLQRWFTQRVNHSDPNNNNTFQQRYWIGTKFYKPGGPVVVIDGGETSGYHRVPFMQTGVGRYLTEALNGIGIVLEHRFYGESILFPDPELNKDTLKLLNTKQSLADNAYFAENLWKYLPEEFAHLKPAETPFFSYGGSYAGSKSAFLRIKYPETYYGSLASSAVIWAGENFWEYNEPVRKYGDPTCTAIIGETAKRIDWLSAKGGKEWLEFKKKFGVHLFFNEDAANWISMPLGMWQLKNWDNAEEDALLWDDFCANITEGVVEAQSWLENDGAQKILDNDAPVEVSNINLERGIQNFAVWTRASLGWAQKHCGDSPVEECLSTQDSSAYKELSLEHELNLWGWQSCTEWGYLAAAAPPDHPTLIARLVTIEYLRRYCIHSFKLDYDFEIDTSKVLQYGGFNLTAPRLMYIDGTHDPWLYATAHSPYSPQKDREDDLSVLINESWHHNDENGLGDIDKEPERIQKVHRLQIQVVKGWVEQFYQEKHNLNPAVELSDGDEILGSMR